MTRSRVRALYVLKSRIHLCVGTAQETKSVAQTVIETALERSKTLAFNYASQALNNSFFLDFLVRQRLAPGHHSVLSPH